MKKLYLLILSLILFFSSCVYADSNLSMQFIPYNSPQSFQFILNIPSPVSTATGRSSEVTNNIYSLDGVLKGTWIADEMKITIEITYPIWDKYTIIVWNYNWIYVRTSSISTYRIGEEEGVVVVNDVSDWR